jgi:NADH-quinone oxidoreductase subunit N
MLGLGGIPFTAGFAGKVAVFVAAADAGYLWLVVLGLVTTVIGLYFYLRVISIMFMRQPVLAEAPGTATASPHASPPGRLVLAVAVAVTVLMGVLPWPLLDIARRALPL